MLFIIVNDKPKKKYQVEMVCKELLQHLLFMMGGLILLDQDLSADNEAS